MSLPTQKISPKPENPKTSLQSASLDNSHGCSCSPVLPSVRYAGPTTVQRGAALETDWRTGMKAAIQLRTGAARRLSLSSSSSSSSGQSQGHRCRQLHANKVRPERGRGNQSKPRWSLMQRDAQAFLDESRTDTPKTDTPC